MKRKYKIFLGSVITLIFAITILISNNAHFIKSDDVVSDTQLLYPKSNNIDEIIDVSSIVISGHYTKFIESWNMARNPENINEPDSEYYLEGRIYEFTLDKNYKGIIGDKKKIRVNIPYAHQGNVDEIYLEPALNTDVILCLNYDKNFDLYYPALEPYMFAIENEEITPCTNIADIKTEFSKEEKKLKLTDIEEKTKKYK